MDLSSDKQPYEPIKNPLTLDQISSPLLKKIIQLVSRIDVLEGFYEDWIEHHKSDHGDPDAFIDFTLGKLDVDYDIFHLDNFNAIPKDGPLVIVANHPLGGLEGMLLAKVLRSVRPDLKVLTNEVLKIFPEFDDIFIGVDVMNKGQQRKNAKGLGLASKHLAKQGALLVFPAGTVSQLTLPSFRIEDAPWNSLITRLARKYNAAILPVFVEGRNSIPFYLSGYIHKRLRTAFLPRAMMSKAGESIPLYFGPVIPSSDLQRMTDDAIAMHYVRLCSEMLGDQPARDIHNYDADMADIHDDVDLDMVNAHLQTLDECILHRHNEFVLYGVSYDRMGPVMDQLAIDRERTFRQVDEGTGRAFDRDEFDPHYTHLFLWDDKNKCIAGGYRIGLVDRIVEQQGLNGLYSHSLFHYDEKFLAHMGKTMEVGRSFITTDYQRHPRALDILWKGIGRFVAQNSNYHTLFGCVSISRQYSRLATALLSDTFLTHYGADISVQRQIKARRPFAKLKKPWSASQLSSLSEIPVINKLVGRIDNGKSIPVLIRHYLALNGRFMSFTVNTGFNNALDGLIMVDLRTTSDKYLKRYMGQTGFENFRNYWKAKHDAA